MYATGAFEMDMKEMGLHLYCFPMETFFYKFCIFIKIKVVVKKKTFFDLLFISNSSISALENVHLCSDLHKSRFYL